LATAVAVTPKTNTLQNTAQRSLPMVLAAARTAAENRGQDIVVLDLHGVTPICDYFLIVTGQSRRQLHAICDEINRAFKQHGDARLGREGYDTGDSRWLLLDYGDIVVHLFDEETRKFYDLEGLWSDAERVDLSETLRGV
jgi:ribosome-associated protein